MRDRPKTVRADKIKCGDFLENRWGAWEMVQSIAKMKELIVFFSYGEIRLLTCKHSDRINIRRCEDGKEQ